MKKLTSAPVKILADRDPNLAPLLRQVNLLKQLNDLVKGQLPEPLRHHVQVANFHKGRLLIEVDSNSHGSSLHYEKMELLSRLRKIPDFGGIISIETRVNPGLLTAGKKPYVPRRAPVKLSHHNLQLILQLAATTEDKKLRESLLKIIAHQQGN